LFSFTSRTITRLTIIAQNYDANPFTYTILTEATLPSLKNLHLQVDADGRYAGAPGTSTDRHDIDWRERFPSLSSVHFVITRWARNLESFDPGCFRPMMYGTVIKSHFLTYCLKEHMLTAIAYTCGYDEIAYADEADYRWSSDQLLDTFGGGTGMPNAGIIIQ
jgi:hypothetical protein